ncbi:hypothetical protein D3C77_411940 [compost metagenome]
MNAGHGNLQRRQPEHFTKLLNQATLQYTVPLGIVGTDLGQHVERHLAVKETRLQRAGIEQFRSLPRELIDGLATLSRNRQASCHLDTLDIEQALQRCEGDRQGHGCSARAADLGWRWQVIQASGVGFRNNGWRLVGRQTTGQVDHRATGGLGTGRETAGNRWPGGEEGELDLAEVETVDFTHPQALAAKHHTTACRFVAGQQVQGSDGYVLLFENLHKGFTDCSGGTNHGDINRLAHGKSSAGTAGAALYLDL